MIERLLGILILVGLAACNDSQTTEAVVAPAPPDAVGDTDGEETYNRFCFSCHAAGIAGAPKVGDADAWAPRVAKGTELLLQTTIEGIPPGMPPDGLCVTCSEDELRGAIDYMIVNSQ